MRKRLVMTAVIAAILGGAAGSAFRAPWYHATAGDYRTSLQLIDLDEPVLVLLAAILVNLYFFVRLMFTGILLLNGGPTSTRVIAWYTPLGARVQGGCSLVASVVLNALTPSMTTLLDEPMTITRSWGGVLLVACNVLAQVAIAVIARDRVLAKTQTWVDDDGLPVPKKQRWIRIAPQARPLVKPPLATTAGGDPFRSAPATGLEAALVKPAVKAEAPRKDDEAAPAPKLLT